ncbi:MAG TPA: hypothetical protein VNO32_00520, partial [Candidatus Acidoferrum sp.]|nr:hypothetical protein [Candidatus Acidoferrum sp.]
FVHTQSSVGFTIITSGFEFSVHTTVEFRSSSAPAGSGNRVRRSFLRFTIERPHHADPRMQQSRSADNSGTAAGFSDSRRSVG